MSECAPFGAMQLLFRHTSLRALNQDVSLVSGETFRTVTQNRTIGNKTQV